MDEALEAEFDAVAGWTAEVAVDLGPDFYVPAACRGSGSPAVLSFLVDRLGITAANRMLDCGAGVGGPAALAADRTGVRPVLTDPEPGACRAANRLFRLPAVQAETMLPLRTGAFDVAWSLGVLCTVPDQPAFLRELRRVVAPGGQLGLLVFVAAQQLTEQPAGNSFPTVGELASLVTGAGWRIAEQRAVADFPAAPADWTARADAVDAELDRRHRGDPRWQVAVEQSTTIGSLLSSGELGGVLLLAD